MTTVPALTDEAALNQYVATGGQTDFNFSFMIFATADIKVYVNGVLKTEVTDYTVKKSGGGSISSSDLPLDGGKVVFVSGLTADDEVTLSRDIAIARLTGYSVAGAFRADVVNAEFTKGYAISQQLRRDLERSIRLAPFDSEGGDLTLPTGRASQLIGFDAAGNIALFGAAVDNITPVSAFMATVLDDTTASAALTTLGFSAYIQTLLNDADAAAVQATLGLVIGTNVQAYDADLSAVAALNSTGIAVRSASNTWVQRSLAGAGLAVASNADGASGNPTITVTSATKSDQETGTSTTTVVTPAIQHQHKSACKAWAQISYSGGVPAVQNGYGVTSLTDSATGDGNVNLTNAFTSAPAAVTATNNSTASALGVYMAPTSTTVLRWVTKNSAGVDTDYNFSFQAFGLLA